MHHTAQLCFPFAAAMPLKLPGSKRRTFAQIMPHLPRPEPGRGFVLPFFGTGADARYLTAAGYRLVALGDSNPHLCHALHCLREHTADTLAAVAREAAAFPRDLADQRSAYFAWRADYNDRAAPILDPKMPWRSSPAPELAALYLCLWRTAFNGLARCNSAGLVNAPPGMTRCTGPKGQVVDLAALADYAAWLGTIPPVQCADYAEVMAQAEPGDVTYHDPPYLGSYDGYFGKPFDTDRLVRLITEHEAIAPLWALSNKPHTRWSSDFPHATIHSITRAGTISCKGAGRAAVPEILIVSSHARATIGAP